MRNRFAGRQSEYSKPLLEDEYGREPDTPQDPPRRRGLRPSPSKRRAFTSSGREGDNPLKWLYCLIVTFVTGKEHADERTLECMHVFKIHCAQPYNPSDGYHERMLRDLWGLLDREQPLGDHISTARWKRFGFQGLDPATDFRGGGLLSLSNLLYFAEAYPELLERILHPSIQEGEAMPFAIAGINLTMMWLNLLQLTDRKTCLTHHEQNTSTARKSRGKFTRFLAAASGPGAHDVRGMERVFGEVYSASMSVLHQEWRKSTTGLMGFNQVLLRCRHRMDTLLCSCSDVQDLLARAGL